MTPRQRDFLTLLGLGIGWALAVAFVGVSGEFPLNDDWAYAHSVRIFVETGEIERVAWTWASIVTHIWAGALASHAVGFSLETLRWTGILFGFGACAAAYGLGRACGLEVSRSAAVALTLAVCPVHFNPSFTFMTDPPFAFWVTFSLFAIAITVRASGAAKAVGATLTVIGICGAALLRQPGAAIAAALIAAVALGRARSVSQIGIGTAVGVVAGVAALALAGLLFDADNGGGPMIEYFFRRVLANPNLAYFIVVNGLAVCVYLGWFTAPIAPFISPRRYARQLAGASLAMAVVVPLLVAKLLGDGPPGTNIIWDFGLGGATLAGLDHLPRAPRGFWWFLNAVGAGCGTWFVGSVATAIALRFDDFRRRSELVVLLLFPALYIGVLALRLPFFDRYLSAVLPALAVLGLVVAGRSTANIGRVARSAAALACALLAAFSLLGTRDYMERHRSRQVLLDQLESDGISARRIDGGFEFSGLHNFDSDETKFLENARRWVYDDEFLLTYAPSRAGYRPIRSVDYRRLLPPGREQIHLLKRIAADEGLSRHSPDATGHR